MVKNTASIILLCIIKYHHNYLAKILLESYTDIFLMVCWMVK